MPYLTTNNLAAVLQVSALRDFLTYKDDTASNVMPNYGLLRVYGDQTATGNIKVTLAGEESDELEFTGVTAEFINNENLLVKKVWDTGTTFADANIKVVY